jgi:hypothetical protein
MQRSWTINAIWILNSIKWRKWCTLVSRFLFNNCFGTGHYAYMCSQWAPIVEITYCMFKWSIYRLFVLNTGGKHKSLEMLNFLYVSSTSGVVGLKTRVETWIARNYVNCVYLFHFSNLIIVWAYLCSHWATLVQFKYFMFHWSINRIFVPSKARKLDSLQMVIFVYVCSIVEVKTRFET